MEKLRVFETFAGIGAQHKALERLKEEGVLDYEVVATSEWDIDAILAYNVIHNHDGEYKLNKKCDPRKYTFSADGKQPISNINRLSKQKYKLLLKACEENRNYGSIAEIKAKDLPNFDLLTYSFPCQDLSIASMGRGKGMSREAESRSGLLWQIERILKELEELSQTKDLNFMDELYEMPKYLLLENVSAMLHKNNIEHYQEWLGELKKMGYVTLTTKLRSDDFGIPQKRERVFAISIKMDEYTNIKDIKNFFDLENIDLLSSNIDLFQDIIPKTREKILQNRIYGTRELFTVTSRDQLQEIIDEGNKAKYLMEREMAAPNHTASREKMRKENYDLSNKKQYFVRTLTTKQDRHPNAGMLVFDNHNNVTSSSKISSKSNGEKKIYRFLTSRECYMLMGFDSNDYSKVFNLYNSEKNNYQERIIRKEKMYQQAGNSIVVNVLEAIFKTIWEFENEKSRN